MIFFPSLYAFKRRFLLKILCCHDDTSFHLKLTSLKPWVQLVQFSLSVVSNSLLLHESQHARPPCPSPTPRVYSNPCPSSQWYHPAISSSVIPFSSCPQSLPESGSFPMSQLFAWGGQSTGVSASASVLPMNTLDWPPLGWTGWISLESKGLPVNQCIFLMETFALSYVNVLCIFPRLCLQVGST